MRFFPYIATVVVAFSAVSTQARADEGFSDAWLGFRYGTDFREPAVTTAAGNAADVAKRIYNFTFVDGNRYGGDFLVVDGYLSDSADPNKLGDAGEHEIYVVYRHTFALSAFTGTNYGFGPVRDTDLVAGVDLNTKDTTYAPRKRMFVLGPQFEFAVPSGFFKASLLAEKEYDHNGIVRSAENFDTTWALESSWLVPFHASSLPLQFEGYLGIYGPKGRDDFGAETKTETLLHPRVMADIGALAGTKGRVFAGVGYEYWYNKYGVDHTLTPGAVQHAVLVELAVRL
jgi:nucleoside-specific outer membrane channel protein Tsx